MGHRRALNSKIARRKVDLCGGGKENRIRNSPAVDNRTDGSRPVLDIPTVRNARLAYIGRDQSESGFYVMLVDAQLLENVEQQGDFVYGAVTTSGQLISYTVFSYRCSIDSKSEKVEIPVRYMRENVADTISIQISAYLHQALPAMLDSLGLQNGFYAWIDQICMAKMSDEASSSLTDLIPQLYRNASVVNIHLGPPTPNSDIAMAKIEQVMESGSQEERFEAVVGFWSAIDNGPSSDADSPAWLAVYEFIKRPWFRCSESVFDIARKQPDFVYLYCGQASLAWERQIFSFAVALWSCAPGDEVLTEKQRFAKLWLRMVCKSHAASKSFQAGKNMPLINLMADNSAFLSNSAEGKLLSALRFAKLRRPLSLEAAVPLNLTQLNTQITLSCIHDARNLGVLGYGPNIAYSPAFQNPSWAPDWSNPCTAPPLISPGNSLYNPAHSRPGGICLSDRWPLDAKILHLSGRHVADVATVTRLNLSTPLDEDALSVYCGPLPPDHVCRRNVITNREVCLRTLCLDTKRVEYEGEIRYERLKKCDQVGLESLLTYHSILAGRRLFYTTAGPCCPVLMGIGPRWEVDGATLERNDEIWIMKGGHMLHALRKIDENILANQEYSPQTINTAGGKHGSLHRSDLSTKTVRRFVGECFVLGMMDGEEAKKMTDFKDIYLL